MFSLVGVTVMIVGFIGWRYHRGRVEIEQKLVFELVEKIIGMCCVNKNIKKLLVCVVYICIARDMKTAWFGILLGEFMEAFFFSDLVKDNYELHQDNSRHPEFIAVSHVRDQLLAPKQR